MQILKNIKKPGDYFLLLAISALLMQSALSQISNLDLFIVSPTNQFEFIFFIISIFQLDWRNVQKINLAFWTTFYLLLNLIQSLEVGTNIYDYFKESKWIIYLLVIYSTKKENLFSLLVIKKITKILIIFFLFSYIFQVYKGGLNVRPTVFVENNYEIAFILGVYLIYYSTGNLLLPHLNMALYISLAIIVALSGSRSGGIGFLVLSIYVIFSRKRDYLSKFRNLLIFSTSISFIINNVLVTRGSDFRSFDRYRFLSIFIEEIQTRNIFEILFGSFGIRQLSANSCHQLIYYSSLLANQEFGTCYATILHLFILRVIVNFGIIGLILSIILPYFMLKNLASNFFTWTMIALSVINGLSVSGINNVFVMLPILLAIKTLNQISLKN